MLMAYRSPKNDFRFQGEGSEKYENLSKSQFLNFYTKTISFMHGLESKKVNKYDQTEEIWV